MIFLKELAMRRRSLLPLLVILMFLFPLLQAGNSPAKGLDGRQQSMVLVSAYTANGDLERLRPTLDQALDAGLTINEIKEVLTHLYAYVGFPRSLNGLQVFMEVLEQRRARGITDAEGKAASPLPSTLDRDAYGARVRADLAGQKEIQPPSGVLAFAPVIDTFLKEHLFADIFARDVLDRKARPRSVKFKFRWNMNIVPAVRVAKVHLVPVNADDELVDADGNKTEQSISYFIGDQEIKSSPLTQEDVDMLIDYFSSVTRLSRYDQSINDIINEETALFFDGTKSVDETASIIQSRASIYMSEQY